MNYVDSFNLFETEVKQIPCERGHGAPTTATVGAVGCLYMDVDTGNMYKCTSDANGVYTWGDVSSTNETEIINRFCPPFTESGSVVACEPVEGYPLDVVSKIVPKQDGTGDPTPDNVRPISGHTAVNVKRCGKNLINPVEYIKNNGNTTLDGDVFTTNFTSGGAYVNRWAGAKTHPAGTYTVSIIPVSGDVRAAILVYDNATENMIAKTGQDNQINANLTFTASAPFRITIGGPQDSTKYGTYSYKLQLEVGRNATEYEPYREAETVTFDLGQTVYGGSLDWKSGVLTITKKAKIFDGTEYYYEYEEKAEKSTSIFQCSFGDKKVGWNTSVCSHFTNTKNSDPFSVAYCKAGTYTDHPSLTNVYFDWGENTSTSADFQAWLAEQYANGTPVTLVYDLAEPITVQLTPQEILALSGVNTIYADTGDITITGKADPIAIIQDLCNKVNALSATATALTGV